MTTQHLPTRADQLPIADSVENLEVFGLKEGRTHRLRKGGFQAYVNDETARRVEAGVAPFLDLIAGKANTDSLAEVAKTGDYGDLTNKPVLGSAAAADTTDFATAAQGALAATALQPTTGVVRLPTFAYASIASGLTDVQRVFVEDRRAHFARVGSEPAHGVKFENDGWWSLDELTVTPFMAGAAGDGTTDDTTAVAAIVGYAKLTGAPIYAPDADFKTTASIADLHNVVWTGPGRIVRGSNIWRIAPTGSNTNAIYVSNSGNNNNDGLSASEPKLTLQNALDQMILHRRPHLMDGYWKIVGAAGTYARVRFPDEGLPSYNPIEIAGPDVGGHPNVPTMIISEGSNGVSAVGVRTRERTETLCRDIHFIGFNGSSSSAGYDGGYYTMLASVNCHYTNCTWGISGVTQALIDVKGGVFDGNGFNSVGAPYSAGGGVRGLFSSKFEVGTQNAGSLDNGPIFKNNNFGVFGQEHCNGHIDFCTFEDNGTAIRTNILSRLNSDGSSFKRNNVAVWGETDGVVFTSANTVFGTGADANNINVVFNGGGGLSNLATMFTSPATIAKRSNQRRIIAEVIDQTINTTGATIFATLTLKGGMWKEKKSSVSAVKKISFRLTGKLTGANDIKRVSARFGSAAPISLSFGASETGEFEANGHVIINVGNDFVADQLLMFKGYRHLGTNTRLGNLRLTETLDNDTNVQLEASVVNTSDSITIYEYEFLVDGL